MSNWAVREKALVVLTAWTALFLGTNIMLELSISAYFYAGLYVSIGLSTLLLVEILSCIGLSTQHTVKKAKIIQDI